MTLIFLLNGSKDNIIVCLFWHFPFLFLFGVVDLWLTQVGTCGMVKASLAIPSLESVFCCKRYFLFLKWGLLWVGTRWGYEGWQMEGTRWDMGVGKI